jgi:hypothetical protein
MPLDVKNSISHRGKALEALKEHFMNISIDGQASSKKTKTEI